MSLEILDRREVNAVLAGLRLLQSQSSNLPIDIEDIATDGDESVLLDDEAIDELCERINLEGLCVGEAS